MRSDVKSAQLQIRVSKSEKAAIQRAASRAGMDASTYVLSRALPHSAAKFRTLLQGCVGEASPRYVLAELNSVLTTWTSGELVNAISERPPPGLTAYVQNYIAAMVEYACAKRGVAVPHWTRRIMPLSEPVFATSLKSLRLHLLMHSPPPFRARNIFIDTSLGGQV